MTGKGRCQDNSRVERLWRSVKYEEVFLRVHDNGIVAARCLKRYFSFYNRRRPHQGLAGKTPDQVYYGS